MAQAWLLAAALPLLATGCSRGFDDEPLDGGGALQPVSNDADSEQVSARDPCRRRERNGWHYSVQHCAEMLPPQRMTGVWVRAFELSNFYPGATSFAEMGERRRATFELEVYEPGIVAAIGHPVADGDVHAVVLTFIGRRTRIPSIDCQRGQHYTIVVDRIERAEALDMSAAPPTRWGPPPPPFPPSPEGTALRRLEDEMVASCEARDRTRD